MELNVGGGLPESTPDAGFVAKLATLENRPTPSAEVIAGRWDKCEQTFPLPLSK